MDKDKEEVLRDIRRQMCDLYGYDENLKFTGAAQLLPLAEKPQLEARDFLRFAAEDSKDLSEGRNRVNCLSNCKRAIDAQLDRLISQLGFRPVSKKERWNSPKKIDFILNSGLVAPRILQRLNQLRNRLEHEFAGPTAKEVEDALDVATLFISYAENVSIPVLNWTLRRKLTFKYDYEEMTFHFFEKNGSDYTPLFTLSYGEKGFQEFYDFLTRTVPAMEREEGFDTALSHVTSISIPTRT
jgi:hypothetical protein